MATLTLSPDALNALEQNRGTGRRGVGENIRTVGHGSGGTAMFVAPRSGDIRPTAIIRPSVRNGEPSESPGEILSMDSNVHVRTDRVDAGPSALEPAPKVLRAPDQRFPVEAPAFPVESLIVEQRDRAISAYRDALALTTSGAPPLALAGAERSQSGGSA